MTTSIGVFVPSLALDLDPVNGLFYNIKSGDLHRPELDRYIGHFSTLNGIGSNDDVLCIATGHKSSDTCPVADSTCFYIGNDLILTAGHHVFDTPLSTPFTNSASSSPLSCSPTNSVPDEEPAIRDDILTMKVVFGLTQGDCSRRLISVYKVFDIERYVVLIDCIVPTKFSDRICFGQTQSFAHDDRADWAVLKLAVSHTDRALLPSPLKLRKWRQESYFQNVWAVRHPWSLATTYDQHVRLEKLAFVHRVKFADDYASENNRKKNDIGHDYNTANTSSSFYTTNSLGTNPQCAPVISGSPILFHDITAQLNEFEVIGIVTSSPANTLSVPSLVNSPGTDDTQPCTHTGIMSGITNPNICRSLTHTDMACFVAMKMPSIKAHITFEILFGDSPDNWTSHTMINDCVNIENERLQVVQSYMTINAITPTFRPWLIRAIRLQIQEKPSSPVTVASYPVPEQWRQERSVTKAIPIMFGCMDYDDLKRPENWTILASTETIPTDGPVTYNCGPFIKPAWKSLVGTSDGIFDNKVVSVSQDWWKI